MSARTDEVAGDTLSPGMLSALGVPVDLAPTLDLLAATYADGTTDLDPVLLGLDERNRPRNGEPSNIDAMAGNRTVLQQGIEKALHEAGAQGTGVPVMLVGHSQGGIVAAQSTNDLISGGCNVTHVVTADSPVGRIDIPGNVQVLSLENKGDIVPHLDAGDNPNTANRTTVTFENQTGSVGGNHDLGGYRYDEQNPGKPRVDQNYVAVAGQLDQSSDPSVRRFLDSADVFTQGGPKSTTLTC